MKLKILYADYSTDEFDLDEYMYIGGEHCLTITKKIGWEKYNRDTCPTEVIPYANIFKYWTANKESEG